MVLLGLLSIGGNRQLASTASRHLTLVALVFFGVYVHRDILPLATFALRPLDDAQGPLLWIKIAFITYIGVVEPLVEPKFFSQSKVRLLGACHVQSPDGVHPQDNARSTTVNPEQTASLASQLSYSFLNPTVFQAYRMPHLPADQLPPLCDYDEAKRLKERSQPVSRHVLIPVHTRGSRFASVPQPVLEV